MMICSKFKGAGGSTPSYEMETPTVGLLPRLPHRALTLVGSAEQERKEKKRKARYRTPRMFVRARRDLQLEQHCDFDQ